MNLNKFFCVGSGYLDDLIALADRVIARVKVFTHFDASILNKDEVWINMIVIDKELQAQLRKLFKSVKDGSEVIITFEAVYNIFVCAYSGLKPEDPSHIVTLQSKLGSLGSCYINGQLAETHNCKLKAVA